MARAEMEVLSRPGAPVTITQHADGRRCFTQRYRGRYTNPKDRTGIYRIGRFKVVAYENIYSSMWNLYDPETGEDIGDIRRGYFERIAHKVADLVEDPDC